MADQRKVRARKALLAQVARARRAKNPKKYAAKARGAAKAKAAAKPRGYVKPKAKAAKPRGYVKPKARAAAKPRGYVTKSSKAYYAAKKKKSKFVPAWRTLGNMKLYNITKKKPCNCGRKIK